MPSRHWGAWSIIGLALPAALVAYVAAVAIHVNTWDSQDFGARARTLLSEESGTDLSHAPTVVGIGSPPARFVCVTADIDEHARTYAIIYYRGHLATRTSEMNTPAHPSQWGGIDADVSGACRPIDAAASRREMLDSMQKQALP